MEYRPGDEFMGLIVKTCTAMQLEGFNPQELANVINGVRTPKKRGDRCASIMQGECSDANRLRQAGVSARRGLHGAVCEEMYGHAAGGLRPSEFGEHHQR